MAFGTVVFGGAAGDFATSRTLSVDFGSAADRALIVEVMNTGGTAGGVTGVVIDPAGANIAMTAEPQTGPAPGVGASGYLRRFRAFGPAMPTGIKNVVISVAAGDSIINARAIPMDGVTAIAAGVAANAAASTTWAVAVPTAAGRQVLMSAVSMGVPDARTLTVQSPAALVKRPVVADHYYMHGIIVQTAGAGSSVTPTVTLSTGTDAALMGWDLTLSGDSTPPTLSSPTGTGGTLTAGGTVSTDEGNGTLYAVFTGSATAPTAEQVEAGQDHTGASALRAVSQVVSATGAQSIASGSITSGTRYAHYMHKDAAGNRSAVAGSASFSVAAGGDTTPPTMTGSVTVTPASTTASALCPTAADNVAVTAYECSIDGGSTWPFTSATPTISITGLTPSTAYTARFRARDAAGNLSTPVLVQAFNTLASGNPTVTVPGLAAWTGTLQASLTVPNVVIVRRSDRAQVLALTNVAADSSGNLVISNAALAVGVGYMVFGFTADGANGFQRPVTAV